MPTWATRLTTIGQLITVLAAIGAITWLATSHVIDGGTAIGALALVTGAGGLAPAVMNAVSRSGNDAASTTSGQARNVE
jgi:hypothetical protein